jgi:hypothetical protein
MEEKLILVVEPKGIAVSIAYLEKHGATNNESRTG